MNYQPKNLAALCYRKPQLAKMLGVSTRTLDRREAEGRGVPGKFLLGSTALWDAMTVDQWLARQAGRADGNADARP